MVVPVILAGGCGTRLWPLSRSAYPKQLLRLTSDKTLLQETILRTQLIQNISTPTIICNEEHRFLIAEQLHEIGIVDATIILEPMGKNTAPAATVAALYHLYKNPLLLILPADHIVKNIEQFTTIINKAIQCYSKNQLVTFGVRPTRAESGYGYIKISDLNPQSSFHPVNQFIEKPDIETAQTYIASGQYYWNSGMFMFRAAEYLAEIECYAPEILQKCKQSLECANIDLDFIRLNKTAFATCTNNSIDYAVMEKTKNAVLMPLDTDWNDIGSWLALCDAHEADKDGNVLQGDIITDDVKNSYLRAESRMLAAFGISDHIIVETPDAVLVAHKNKSHALKNIIAQLKQNKRTELDAHWRVYRPWGYYESLHRNEYFQVKRIIIKPGASLSLQMHQHRSEHWVVVRGTAQVTRSDEIFTICENESTYIPKNIKHRLINNTAEVLEMIEVQLGNYLSEDDIIRFEDNYGRVE